LPITPLLMDSSFTPEQRHVLELAFNNALRKLNLVDRSDPACEIVAREVIKVGRSGVTNAVAITEIACRQLDFAATSSHPAATAAASPGSR
jgi:hypothetical protein